MAGRPSCSRNAHGEAVLIRRAQLKDNRPFPDEGVKNNIPGKKGTCSVQCWGNVVAAPQAQAHMLEIYPNGLAGLKK